MYPVLTTLQVGAFQLRIGSYGVCLAVASLVFGGMTVGFAHKARMDVGASIAAVGAAMFGALCGAVLLFVVVQWARMGTPMLSLGRFGFVYFGGLWGGTLAMVIAARRLGLAPLRVMDAAVPALCFAHAVGRVGCLLGGCCYGSRWTGPWAVYAPNEQGSWMHRHPAAVYEAAGLVLVGVGLSMVSSRPPGRRVILYLISYSCLRLFTEQFRGDELRGVFFGSRFSTSQLISLVILMGVAAFLTRRRHAMA